MLSLSTTLLSLLFPAPWSPSLWSSFLGLQDMWTEVGKANSGITHFLSEGISSALLQQSFIMLRSGAVKAYEMTVFYSPFCFQQPNTTLAPALTFQK